MNPINPAMDKLLFNFNPLSHGERPTHPKPLYHSQTKKNQPAHLCSARASHESFRADCFPSIWLPGCCIHKRECSLQWRFKARWKHEHLCFL